MQIEVLFQPSIKLLKDSLEIGKCQPDKVI